MFVKRDFVTLYKQTILGPLWFIIQPLFTTLVLRLFLGMLPKSLPIICRLFCFICLAMLLGPILQPAWEETSDTFNSNAGIFGKVYFPRLTVPIFSHYFGPVAVRYPVFSFPSGFYFYFMIAGSTDFTQIVDCSPPVTAPADGVAGSWYGYP